MIDFLYELGQMKRVKRSGWWMLGIKDPESVADHAFRTAAIGYILAKKEGVDPNKVVIACLFHDIHETRTNDAHKVAQRYLDVKKGEQQAFSEQMACLPEDISADLIQANKEYNDQSTREGIVARDADLLECALQAKEYYENGYKKAINWINNTQKIIKTETAKNLLKDIIEKNPYEWWKDLKKIER